MRQVFITTQISLRRKGVSRSPRAVKTLSDQNDLHSLIAKSSKGALLFCQAKFAFILIKLATHTVPLLTSCLSAKVFCWLPASLSMLLGLKTLSSVFTIPAHEVAMKGWRD
jgi:hypothetical protein